MKRIIYFMAALLFCVASVSAQVTIGENSDPHKGAVLDLKSDSKGLLLPKVSLNNVNEFQLSDDATGAEGMLVYNTNDEIGEGVYVWTKISGSSTGGTDPVVSVTGVSLNKTTLSFTKANATEALAATVTPSDATNKNVRWSSSNEAVATVSSNGVVTSVTAGNATITAATVDGGYIANCAVTVTTTLGYNLTVDNGVYNGNYSGNYFNALDLDANISAIETYFTAANKTLYVQDEDISTDRMTWNNAVNACSAAGGRLPTLYELAQLQGSQAYGLRTHDYWSSTEYSSDAAWLWSFGANVANWYEKIDNGYAYVRCVRSSN